MKTYGFLLIPFFAAAHHLSAGAIASVAVDAAGGAGPPTCSLTSTGAHISCSATFMGFPVAFSEGQATASLGFLSSSTNAGGGVSNAHATAQYDYLLNFPGVGSGTITGQYLVHGSTQADFMTTGTWGLSIGQGSSTLAISAPPHFLFLDDTVTLSSAFTEGQTLEITGFVSGHSNSPGTEMTNVSVQLIGFFDVAGNPLPFADAQAPEPVLWPVVLLSLAILYRWKPVRN
jgi:hypothetical protein